MDTTRAPLPREARVALLERFYGDPLKYIDDRVMALIAWREKSRGDMFPVDSWADDVLAKWRK